MPSQNLLVRSQTLSTTWSPTNCTVSANALGPDGSAAWTLTESNDGAPADHVVLQSATAKAGVKLVFTVYAKAGTRSQIFIGGNAGTVGAYFDLAAASVLTLIGAVGTSVRPVYNTDRTLWGYAYSVIFDGTGATPGQVRIYTAVASNTSYQGNGTGTVIVWRTQLEQSNAHGEYVETAAAAVNIGAPANKRSN